MVRLMGAGLSSFLLVTPAHPQAMTASPADIAAAARACDAAVKADGVDADYLSRNGWKEGHPSAPDRRFFLAPPNAALIEIKGTGSDGTCTVSTSLATPQQLTEVIDKLATVFGKPQSRTASSAHWEDSGKIVDLPTVTPFPERKTGTMVLIDVRPRSVGVK
jgi:hypothetical protein